MVLTILLFSNLQLIDFFRILFVSTFSGYCLCRLFPDIVCVDFFRILFVSTFSGYCLCRLFPDIVCVDFFRILFVSTFSGYCLCASSIALGNRRKRIKILLENMFRNITTRDNFKVNHIF